MKISIVAVGTIKDRFYKEGIEEYTKRLSRFCQLELIESKEEPIPEKARDAQILQIKQKETKNALKHVHAASVLIVLDVNGKPLDSVAFAEKINGFMLEGKSHLTFLIGGSCGLCESALQKADMRLSMSKMTFPHRLARLILTEQIYRAFKIIKGETYHK